MENERNQVTCNQCGKQKSGSIEGICEHCGKFGKSTKVKYVVLEHLLMPDKGLRFFTTNHDNNTHSMNGELWYKEVGFTDSIEEAQAIIRQQTFPTTKIKRPDNKLN